jgi:hypothetical protein
VRSEGGARLHAEVGDSGSDRLARPSERAGRGLPSRSGVTLAAETAHLARSGGNLLATVLPRRAIRIGGAGLVDTAGRSVTGGKRSPSRVAREADAVERDAHPLQRVAPTHALAVEVTVVVARHRARARRTLWDVGVGGRAGRSGAVGGRTGASTVVSAGIPVSAAVGAAAASVRAGATGRKSAAGKDQSR